MKTYLGKMLLLALAYFVTGRLGLLLALLLALPPGYATAMWPPSGLALAGILLLGYRYWPGVLLGSFAVNLFTSYNPSDTHSILTSGSIAAIIAGGTALQAVGGAWLCRRFIKFPNALGQARDVGLLLLLGGPIGCLASSLVGAGTLVLFDLIPIDKALFNWLIWWVGDSMGVLVLTPMMLLICSKTIEVDLRRKIVVSLTLFGALAVTVIIFIVARNWEHERQRLTFEKKATLVAAQLEDHLIWYKNAIYAVSLFYAASNDVNRDEFKIFAASVIEHRPGMKGLTWAPKVTDSQRKQFEAIQRREGVSDFAITELNAQDQIVPAAQREVYYPATYLEPLSGTRYGFDTYSEEIRKTTLEKARDTGLVQATPRIKIVQRITDNYGMLVFQPVYQNGKSIDTIEERRRHLRGVIIGIFSLPDLIRAGLQNVESGDVDFYIIDDDAPPEKKFIYNSRAPDYKGGDLYNMATDQETHWQKQINVAGRPWTLHFTPARAALLAYQDWTLWIVLAGGLVFTGACGVFVMVITARADVIRRLVEERTRQWQESESRHQNIIETAIDGIITIDEADRIVTFNPASEKLFGYRAEEVVGRNIAMLMPEPQQDEYGKYLKSYRETGVAQISGTGRAVQGRRKNGTAFFMELSLSAIKLANRRIFTGIIRDITERNRFEQALRASEEAFRSAMENAPIGMALVGIDGTWLRVNSALCKLVGYTERELLATNVQSLTHPDDAKSSVEYMHRLMLGETSVYQVEKRYLHKKRHIIWVLLSLSVVRSDEGKPKHFVAQIQDITARREIDRMKNEFISTVSHELRTPLTSIRGALGLIEGGASGEIPEKAMNLVQIAHKNSQRLLRIINDILDVEKMESGKMEIHVQAMPVEPFLKQALEANQSYSDKFQVRFVLEPVAAMDIMANPDRLMQVITNLISNAAKFSPKGSEVMLRVRKAGDYARFEVIDHGQGIPEEFRGRIFDKFVQVDSSDTRRHEGTGLGLSIAQQLVELMGGDIGFTSEVGKGSTFFFHIPLATNEGSKPSPS